MAAMKPTDWVTGDEYLNSNDYYVKASVTVFAADRRLEPGQRVFVKAIFYTGLDEENGKPFFTSEVLLESGDVHVVRLDIDNLKQAYGGVVFHESIDTFYTDWARLPTAFTKKWLPRWNACTPCLGEAKIPCLTNLVFEKIVMQGLFNAEGWPLYVVKVKGLPDPVAVPRFFLDFWKPTVRLEHLLGLPRYATADSHKIAARGSGWITLESPLEWKVRMYQKNNDAHVQNFNKRRKRYDSPAPYYYDAKLNRIPIEFDYVNDAGHAVKRYTPKPREEDSEDDSDRAIMQHESCWKFEAALTAGISVVSDAPASPPLTESSSEEEEDEPRRHSGASDEDADEPRRLTRAQLPDTEVPDTNDLVQSAPKSEEEEGMVYAGTSRITRAQLPETVAPDSETEVAVYSDCDEFAETQVFENVPGPASDVVSNATFTCSDSQSESLTMTDFIQGQEGNRASHSTQEPREERAVKRRRVNWDDSLDL